MKQMKLEEALEALHKWVLELRSIGRFVSLAEELTAATLAEAYLNLNGGLSADDLKLIALSTLAKNEETRKALLLLIEGPRALKDRGLEGGPALPYNGLKAEPLAQSTLPYDAISRASPQRLRYIFSIMRRSGALQPSLAARMLERRPALALKLSTSEGLSATALMRADKASEVISKIISKANSYEDAVRIAKSVDPRLLWRVEAKGALKGSSLEALSRASAAVRYASLYFEYGDARYEITAAEEAKRSEELLGRADDPELAKRAADLLAESKAIISASRGSFTDLVKLPLQTLVPIVQDLYMNSRSKRLRRELQRLLSRSLSRGPGQRGRGFTYAEGSHGRLDVRKSTMMYVRLSNDFLVFRVHEKLKKKTLIVDVSGSMRHYSSMALASAAMASRTIDRLILFNDRINALKGPLSEGALIRLLVSLRFEGFTNLSGALLQARGSRRVVVVSDLRQTVAGPRPSETACRLIKGGTRVTVISPPTVNVAELTDLSACGARINVIEEDSVMPTKISRIIRKA